jgi:hypothetical protein
MPDFGLLDVAQQLVGARVEEGEEGLEHEVMERAYQFLCGELRRAGDEVVACGALEALACLTLQTVKAGSATARDALWCIDSPLPAGDPASLRVLNEPPAALTDVLRSTMGVHDLQTRGLNELYALATSRAAPISQVLASRQGRPRVIQVSRVFSPCVSGRSCAMRA